MSESGKIEASERLHNAEAEIEKLRGELSALRNVLAGILRDTFRSKADVFNTMLQQISSEVDRLENLAKTMPDKTFRIKGAQRFYKQFHSIILESVHGNSPFTDK